MARILIVDDHKEIAELCASTLREDYDLDMVETANKAASMAARLDYDVVLMDIALRRSSGVTAALALRGLGFTGPIIAITGGLVEVDEMLFERARFAMTLHKPFMPDVLRAAVRQQLIQMPKGDGV
jgi:DNA-binding response OmpR family regulator